MEAIKSNPFRLLGVFSNSSEREIQKNKSRLKAYLDVDKPVRFENEFPILGDIQRTEELIEQALSAIEINKHRLIHALFWFIKGNHLDEPAFNHLKAGNIDKASEIWSRATNASGVSPKYYSAFNNLGTLKIATAFNNGTVNLSNLSQGIGIKLKLIESKAFEDLLIDVTDETFQPDPSEVGNDFAKELMDQVKPYFKRVDELNTSTLLDLFPDTRSGVKGHIQKQLISDPIAKIESNVETTKKSRKEYPINGYNLGIDLYHNAIKSLHKIKKIVHANDIKYERVADLLANEIMQCGIDYFQVAKDGDEPDPGQNAKKLVKLAESIAAGPQTQQRVQENLKGLQGWIESAPQREKERKIKDQLEFLVQELDAFQSDQTSIENARSLATKCLPKLQSIKSVLGSADKLYLQLSSAVVNNAMGMAVVKVNTIQENLSNYNSYERSTAVAQLKKVINDAHSLFSYLADFDMNDDLRTRFNQNKKTISDIRANISGNNRARSTTYSPNKSSEIGEIASGAAGCLGEVVLRWGVVIIFLFIMAKACN